MARPPAGRSGPDDLQARAQAWTERSCLVQGVAVKVTILRDSPCTVDPGSDMDVLGPVPVVGQAEYERGIDEL